MLILPEQLQEVEELAGINYGPREIAKYLDIPENGFLKAWAEPGSVINKAYHKGQLMAQAQIDLKLQESAKTGNLTAAQQWQKIKDARDFENVKTKLLEGLL